MPKYKIIILLFFAISIFILIGCNNLTKNARQTVQIDWIDFVQVNDIRYEGVNNYTWTRGFSRELTDKDIGKEYAKVKFNVKNNVFYEYYQIKNGDAAYLEENTSLYCIKGYKPQFRLAAKRDGKWILFQAVYYPNLKYASELFDLRNQLKEILVFDGDVNIRDITDKKVLESIAEDITASPVINKNMSGSNGHIYNIELIFKDDTSASFALNKSTCMMGYIKVPENVLNNLKLQ